MSGDEILVRMLAAVAGGAAIGLERQWRQRMAGLRTNALVSVGSAAFVMMGLLTVDEVSPTRMAAQVVSGIGFLGAGVIMRHGLSVSGLNTAATLWCAAAVGVLAGGGFYIAALIATAVVLAANVLLRPLARRIDRRPAEEATELECAYRFRVVCREADEAQVRALLLQTISKGPLIFQGLRSEDLNETDKVEVVADLVTMGRNDKILEDVVARLSLEPGVSGVSWYFVEQDEDSGLA
jgi:putative Mg2+ transporter-C (MgtC) family protein